MSQVIRLILGSEMFADRDNMIEKNVGVRVTFPLHTHNYYEYFLVTGGRALHVVNGASQVVSRGSLVFVRPSDEHSYDYYRQDDFEFWNAGVSVDRFQRALSLYSIDAGYFDDPPLPLHVSLDNELAEETNGLLATLKHTPDGVLRERMFMMILARILYLMLTGEHASHRMELPSWMLKLIQEMDKPENFIAGLPRLLELANYSQAHVNRAFRQYLYTTPTHYINDLRLRHAYKLLATTGQSILSISNACGFNNIGYFYTVFKNRYALCPNDLRTGAFPPVKKIK